MTTHPGERSETALSRSRASGPHTSRDPLALAFDDVSVDIAGQRILSSISLALPRGEVTAIVGPNGSGKTTLLRCAAGIQRPATGSVTVAGVPMWQGDVGNVAAKARLGYGIAPAALPDALTGRECIALFAGARGLAAGSPPSTLALAATLGYTPWLDHEVATHSLGTRQKLGILLGLIGEPAVVLLDEPVNGLDPVSAHRLKLHLVALAQSGTSVVLATHALDAAERHADRVLLLVDGRLRHEWNPEALAALRADPTRTLEGEMIATLERT